MKARGRLLVILSVVGAFLMASGPVSVPLERRLQGTWVLRHVEQAGMVTSQFPDEIDIRRAQLRELPEMGDFPIDPYEGALILTFRPSRYVTHQYGRLVGRGEYSIDARARPPVLETRGVDCIHFFHRFSSSVFASRPTTTRVQLAFDRGELRLIADADNPEEAMTFAFQRIDLARVALNSGSSSGWACSR